MNKQIPSSVKLLAALLAVSHSAASYAAEPVSVNASDHDGNVPQNTLDNDLSSRWSANGDGQWIEYDLGDEVNVESLDIAFYKGDQRTSTVDIQTSTDGSSWQSVFYGDQPASTAAQQTIDVEDTAAAYVRIVGYGNTSNTWNSLTEVDIHSSPIGQSSSSSSSQNSSASNSASAAELTASASADDGNVAGNVLDNDLGTRWSANGSGQWLELDLGAVQTVGRVDIAFYKGDQRSASFDLQVSIDGNHWDTLVYGANSSGDSTAMESFALPTGEARYIRYLGYGNSANSWNSITEMAVSADGGANSSSSSSVPGSSSSSSSVGQSSSSSSSAPWEGGGNTYTASPDDVADVLAGASGGDEIIVTGSGEISIKNLSFNAPVLVRAASVGGTTLTNATIDNSNNIILQGFVFGPNDESTYLKIVNSTNIQVLRNVFDHTDVMNSQTAIVTTQASQYISIGYNEFRGKNQMFTSEGYKLTGSYIKTQFDDPQMTKNLHVFRNHFKDIYPYVPDGTTPTGDSDREVMAMGIADSQDVVTNNVVEYNLFENCDGENEIITVKTSNNEFRYNTFKNSMGSLSFRLGSNNQAYGNYFYGEGASANWDDDNYQTGGIRVYGEGHQIYDNYMEGLTGVSWRRPILIDSGDTSDSTGGDSHETSSNLSVYDNVIVDSVGGGIHIGSDNYGNQPYDISVSNNLVVSDTGILFNNYADDSSNTWSGNEAYATGSAIAVGGGTLNSAQVTLLSSSPSINKPTPLSAADVGPYAP
ncbi:discoidin domain-containing protein [Gilvimarinus chinensis]|uniref:discoidin domain-containing protein n=1 Tax=Gilvimarinus chinensis TaxID=396005 RepID=UPI0003738D75|nr:discoidin domain-containing protein [Gilvimarinus chinensis]